MTAPLILVDGSSYFFRAFHALPALVSSKGQQTGAVYGVINMVRRLLKDWQGSEVAMIFDAKGATFRHTMYPPYKANRTEMPVELSTQFHPLVDCLKAMGLPVIMMEGVEADDVIGTLARHAVETGRRVVISTSDKDLAQLVNEQVTLINTMTGQRLDIAGVKDKFGVMPNQMIDYLMLTGDTSDNIPGVPKCGPKTAVKWLDEYHTIQNIIDNATAINGKVGEYLRNTIPQFGLYRDLVTIRTDLTLPFTLSDLVLQPRDTAGLLMLARELEFKTLVTELTREVEAKVTVAPAAVPENILADVADIKKLLDKLAEVGEFAFELDAFGTGIGITAANIPPVFITNNLQLFKPLLEETTLAKIGFNLKDTINRLQQHKITLAGMLYDPMVESYVLNSTGSRHDLASLAMMFAGRGVPAGTDIASLLERLQLVFDLHKIIYAKFDASLCELYQTIDMPLISVLATMEACGVLIDRNILAKQGERLKAEIGKLVAEAFVLAGREFNLNSPKQLQEILYVEQNLPVLVKTATGQPSTSEEALQELAFSWPLPQIILQYRALTKLVSTYIDALPRHLDPLTGRVHTHYNQVITATGRLSSTEPNLQNIPIRTEEGRLIRTAFVAPEGCSILAADYSQIELRIMAHISADPGLCHAFAMGWDIHAATASELFGVALDDVTSDHRRMAKVVNFGLIYGMSAFGLAKRLKITREEAKAWIDRYFERYEGVREYMNRIRTESRQYGYVETIFGRKLYLPEINSTNKMRQMAAERAAINAPMQGSAADIIKLAMINFSRDNNLPDVRMIMQVHDELVFEVPSTVAETLAVEVKNIMEHAASLAVPLVVATGIGNNWDEAH